MEPHRVDRFASCNNAQLPCFNSRHWSPGTEAIDAFTSHWGGENNWWCPPISLVPRVIRHAQACGAIGTLVVPCWFSAPFFGSYLEFSIYFYQDCRGQYCLMGSSLILQCLLSSAIFHLGSSSMHGQLVTTL